MPTKFAQQFKRSGGPGLLRQFGETIIYYPPGSLIGREILATVERDVELPSDGVEQVVRVIMCTVLDDNETGISSSEINDGRDEVGIALIPDDELRRRKITRMRSNANGMVRFIVR